MNSSTFMGTFVPLKTPLWGRDLYGDPLWGHGLKMVLKKYLEGGNLNGRVLCSRLWPNIVIYLIFL